jgi:hypothetical protein
VADSGCSLSEKAIRRLKSLRPDYLGVDLNAGQRRSEEMFWVAAEQARDLGLPLEVAVAPESETAEVKRVIQEILGRKVDVCRWLVDVQMQNSGFHSLHRELQALAPVALGSGASFAELNRNRPSSLTEGGVWFSLNPQTHATDDETIVQNLATQSHMLGCIREWDGIAHVSVSPVSLKPRILRCDGSQAGTSVEDELAPDVDERQMTLFGAGWTLGSLKHLAEGGAENITFYETVGRKGLMESVEGLPLQPHRYSIPDSVFPMYHVFFDLAEFKGARVICTKSSDPMRVEGIAMMKSDHLRVMVANLSAEQTAVDLAVDAPAIHGEFKQIDEDNAEVAMLDPESYRSQRGIPLIQSDGVMRCTLKPFAIATIDFLPLKAAAGQNSAAIREL